MTLGFTVTETPLPIEPVGEDPFCPPPDEPRSEPARRHRSASANPADSTAAPDAVQAP